MNCKIAPSTNPRFYFLQKYQWRPLLLALGCCFLWNACHFTDPQLIDAPSIVANPLKGAPLVPFIEFTASEPVRAFIEVNDGSQQHWGYQHPGLFRQKQSIPVFQLNPSKDYKIKIRLVDTWGKEAEETHLLHWKSPNLPLDFPTYKILKSEPGEREGGYTLLSVGRQKTGSLETDYGYLIAFNSRGEVSWFLNTAQALQRIKKYRTGNILARQKDQAVLEIDLTGRVVQQFSGEYLEKGKIEFAKGKGAILDSLSQKWQLTLAQKGHVLQRDLKQLKAAETPRSIIVEWRKPGQESVFEMALDSGFVLLDFLHLPDLMIREGG